MEVALYCRLRGQTVGTPEQVFLAFLPRIIGRITMVQEELLCCRRNHFGSLLEASNCT